MLNDLIIFCAQYLYLLVIAIPIVYFFTLVKDQKKAFALLTVIALPCIYLISRIAAQFYFDPRPFVAGHFIPLLSHLPDNGFPSDHALLTSAIASVVFVFHKKISMALWLLTVVIGTARVMAGVHHTIDIVGAIVISIIITFLVDLALKYQKLIFYNH